MSDSVVSLEQSIGARLLGRVFSVYLLIAVMVTAAHMLIEYYNARDILKNDLIMYEATLEKGIGEALWHANDEFLGATVVGMLRHPSIVGVKILGEEEEEIVIGGTILRQQNKVTIEEIVFPDEDNQFSEIKANQSVNTRTMAFSNLLGVSHSIASPDEEGAIGKVIVYTDTRVILNRVKSGYVMIVLNAFIKTTALWIIFIWFSRKILSHPLSILTNAAHNISLAKLDQFQLDIKTKGRNELKILEEAFKAMVSNLLSARKALEKLNQSLEEKVIERTSELQATLTQLEQQNTTLLASNRKLEDLNNTKEQLLKKLGTLQQSHLQSLNANLEELLRSTDSKLKNPIIQIAREVHQIEETIRPMMSLYLSEKAIHSKRVLLTETNKKQQIIAKMALGGTGVELDIVSSVEEGQKALEEKSYDIICTNVDMVELTKLAVERYPHIQSVFMTSEGAPVYLPTLRQYPFLSNIVSRNDEDRTFTLKNIITTISKLLTNDFFGLEKYLNWGVEVRSHSVIGSSARSDLIREMQSYFTQLGIRRPILNKSVMVVEELLMNAIYDAPVDSDGKALYNHLPRTVEIELKPEEQGTFRYACDGLLLAVSVEDPFGSFHRKTILEYLESCYKGEFGSLQNGKGGAGRGLFQIIETSDLVVVNVKPKIRTEVIVIFNIDPDKPKSTKTTSFHYFYG